MNKQDFYDWKRHPVTQAVFSQLASRVNDLKDGLSESAGTDPGFDRYRTGAIAAYNDMLKIEFEEESQ